MSRRYNEFAALSDARSSLLPPCPAICLFAACWSECAKTGMQDYDYAYAHQHVAHTTDEHAQVPSLPNRTCRTEVVLGHNSLLACRAAKACLC